MSNLPSTDNKIYIYSTPSNNISSSDYSTVNDENILTISNNEITSDSTKTDQIQSTSEIVKNTYDFYYPDETTQLLITPEPTITGQKQPSKYPDETKQLLISPEPTITATSVDFIVFENITRKYHLISPAQELRQNSSSQYNEETKGMKLGYAILLGICSFIVIVLLWSLSIWYLIKKHQRKNERVHRNVYFNPSYRFMLQEIEETEV